MRVRGAGAHFSGDPNRFHDFLLGGSLLQRELGVAADAIRTLRHVRDRYRDQLLGLRRQRAVRENLLAERAKRRQRVRGEGSALVLQFTGEGRNAAKELGDRAALLLEIADGLETRCN